MSDALDRGRAAFVDGAWRRAFENLAAANREAPLAPGDLEQLAIVAQLTGQDAESVASWTRAHQQYLSGGDTESAARCGFWIAFTLLLQGDMAQAGGWLGRAQRLLDEGNLDSVVRGYLMVPGGVRNIQTGNCQSGYETFLRAAEIAKRFHDPTLMTFSLHGQGRALIGLGEIERGVVLLDEAMIAITAGEVFPIVAGGIYCSMIEACNRIYDLGRADEWTTALSQWCASQPDLVPFRGKCMVHRSEILQRRGAWKDAVDEASRACDFLSHPSVQPAVGEAWYRRAELHRLRGEFAEAEEAYRQASTWRKPQPGLALLRLAQGQVDAARAAILHVVEESAGWDRSLVLAAHLEIALAASDVAAARSAAEELATIARHFDSLFLRALAAQAAGAVSLAENDPRAALPMMRTAWAQWRELEAPYETARAGFGIALACRALGDEDTGKLELDAARGTFERLGAACDLAMIEKLTSPGAGKAEGLLTARELEVLSLVATGKTNKAIADQLFISEKTVARHISNIFNKLDLSSRAAATAYAYQHGLV